MCVNPPPKDSSSKHSIFGFNGPNKRLHKQPFLSTSGDTTTHSFPSPLSSTIATSETFTPIIDSEHHHSTSADFDFTYCEDLLLGAEEPDHVSSFDPFLLDDASDLSQTEAVAKVCSFVVESDSALAGLRLSLSQRCRQSRASASDRTSVSSSPSPDEDINTSNSTGTLSFGDALRDISTFVTIIKAYSQETSTTSTISIVIALDILAAYLQIVSIFDALCTQLHDNLCVSAQGSVSELQTLPGLQLAGLSVEHGHLQTKILLQAVAHHFEMIERILGIPVAYRVTGREDLYTGFLVNNQQYGSLMAMVMGDECGKRTLNSLKQNLRNLAQLVYM